jgi:8-oxo-dGTP pyrophosphatase MutT (NUDIX family)
VSQPYAVLRSDRRFTGRVIAVRSDELSMPGGGTSTRDVVEHPGAVAVVALDEQGRVALVEQYRHPVRDRLWELPAGLLDVDGESALTAAGRELREETGLSAASWHVLVDILTSPGGSDEGIRIYLAEGLTEGDRPAGENEEADMQMAWVALEDAVVRVLGGDIRNGAACVGLLAAARTVTDRSLLRAGDTPWSDRPERATAPSP